MFEAGLASIAGGTLMNAIGTGAESSATSENYKYKSAMALRNAQIARMNAERLRDSGQIEAQNIGVAGKARMGSLEAAQSASGLDMSDPSSARVRASQAMLTRASELNAVNRSALDAYNEEIRGQGYMIEAQNAQRSAESAERAAPFMIGKSLLGGATSFAEKWYRGGQMGAY